MKTLCSLFIFNLLFICTSYAQAPEITDEERTLADSLEFDHDILKLVRANTDAEFKSISKSDKYEYPALAFHLEREKGNKLINELNHVRYRLNTKGYIIFKAILSNDAESDQIRIVKFADPLYPIQYMKTQGSYPKLSTAQIFDKIERWYESKGCIVNGAGKNWVQIKFVLPIENTDELAKEMIDFCPALESVYRGYERLSEKLKKDRPEILLEW
ncbi:DUF4253 domain-containing protein [Aquimarina sp. LLG6339-5]|uniref:DUF4253 domain-containing protein n=1 Tax=Aquimarina sp. LLG6339-5 TaxID=3160830 RepID=UPI003865912F